MATHPQSDNAIIAEQLRTNRRDAGIKPSEIDQSVYIYESVANLDRLGKADLGAAVRAHYNAVERLKARKIAQCDSQNDHQKSHSANFPTSSKIA
ncbi:hypothetical protein ACWPKS_15830 [Coraliomargarita sp. W4R72]